jgi:hypothetical protein
LVVYVAQSVEAVHAARGQGWLTGRRGQTRLGTLAGNCSRSDEGGGFAAGGADKTAIRTAGREDSAGTSPGGDGSRGLGGDGGRVAKRDRQGCHDGYFIE